MAAGEMPALPKESIASAQSPRDTLDRKSTRLHSSHSQISYAVFCLNTRIAQCFTRAPGIHAASTGSQPRIIFARENDRCSRQRSAIEIAQHLVRRDGVTGRLQAAPS